MRKIESIKARQDQESPEAQNAKAQLGVIFDTQPKSERANYLIAQTAGHIQPEKFDLFLGSGKYEEFCNVVRHCAENSERDQFIESVLRLTKPFLQALRQHPEYEKMQRKASIEKHGFIPVNEIMSYGIDDGFLHFHLASAKTLGVKEGLSMRERANLKKHLFDESLRAMAEVVRADETVTVVTGTAWVVAKHPEMFIERGFEVAPIDEETRRRYFATETRPVSRASMKREDFLNKYSSVHESAESGPDNVVKSPDGLSQGT